MKTPLRLSLAALTLATSACVQTNPTPPATPAVAPAPAAAPTPAAVATTPKPALPSERSEVKPYDAAQQQRLAWFTQARLGMFIHWGLYAIPAGQWPGRDSKERAEWIMIQENIPSAEYEQLAPKFDPEKFDAKAWVAVAKAAGMKYIVITAKHHDGFSMYDSKVSPYNIVASTPFRRDPLKELAAACKEAGIVFCVYYSIADWHEADSPAEYSQRARDPLTNKQDPARGFHGNPNPQADVKKYDAYMRDQVRELLTNYGPVGIVWFDGGGAFRVENRTEILEADRMAAMIHQLQPAALINNRLGADADYGTPEQRIPGGKSAEPFEVCMTLNGHWGYNRFDTKWKSPATVVRNIADIVSKGGNYLLNVGPTAEGEIPDEAVRILKEVGTWTTANAAAIYGAGATPFGKEADSEEWRCTTQPGKLFFTLLKWPAPDGKFTLPAFPNKIVRAYLLTDPARTPLQVDLTGGAAQVTLPAVKPDSLAPVICVEVVGQVKSSSATEKIDSKKDKES